MDRKELTRFLSKELGVEGIVDGRAGWIRACCPTHDETRPSWGIYTDVEYHPTKCFLCGVNSLLGITMQKLQLSAKEATQLITRYGSFGSGLNKTQLKQLKLPDYDNRIQKTNMMTLEPYMIAPYEGKFINVAKERFPYNEDYLRQLRIGVDRINRRIIMPWFLNGKLVGVTGRHVLKNPHPEPKTLPYFGFQKGSTFYAPSGKIDGSRPLVTLEGEGDAISVNRVYSNTVAVGNATFSKTQRKIVLAHGVSDIIVIRDPDEGGERFAKAVRKSLGDVCKVTDIGHPFKDAGECFQFELKKLLKELLVWQS